ncbi:MAG: hypothetical protein DRP89_07440 [Candidatus Neomarinimicrobiota bacterium]|nr:MAG: hypothetical protein DRP89_07440 [Candidatus Neomarinimicrobiota bacterium]
MFKIIKERFGKFTKIKIENSDTLEYISIIPEFGGNVNEIVLGKEGKIYSILDGYITPLELVKHDYFKGAKLIPFPNRIEDGKYSFNGKDYQLPINKPDENHAIHGFVWNKKLTLQKKESRDKYASVQFKYIYDRTLPGYPFKTRLRITYYLITEKGFKCTTEIKNIDSCKIPIADGWHPYFKTSGKVDELMLKIPAKYKTDVDLRMIPTGERSLFNEYVQLAKIGDTEFDTGFPITQNDGSVTTEIYDPKIDLKIKIWQDTGKGKYNYLQIYIPPSRKSIAIEPMTCKINGFNNKEGLIVLPPNESFKASYGVSIE